MTATRRAFARHQPDRRPLLALGLALLLWTSPAAGAPPAGGTYFTLILGLGEAYDWSADCLRFTAGGLCTSSGHCGSWSPAGLDAFTLELGYQEAGVPVRIDATGRFEDAGQRDSIGGVGTVSVGGQVFNFGFTGRSIGRKACKKLLRRWNIETTPPQPPQAGECLDRADFARPERSPYILPFPTGETYHLSQTYCYLYSSHRNELAYDFDMPLGAEIVAARAGTIVEIIEDLPDDNPWPDNNRVKIEHADGTVAGYLHIQRNSVPFALGDRVEQGEVIARAAMSGTIDPHLHFVVYDGDPFVEGRDVPVNFSNCDGPIDALGGLIQNQDYLALPD